MSRSRQPLQNGVSNHITAVAALKDCDKPVTTAQLSKLLQADVLGWSNDDIGSLLSSCKKMGLVSSEPGAGGRNNRAHAWQITQAGITLVEEQAALDVPPIETVKAFLDRQTMLSKFLYLTPPPIGGVLR